MAKLRYGDKVTYITPNGSRPEKALVLAENTDGTLQIVYHDGFHAVVVPRAFEHHGRVFGSYRPGWDDD